MLDRDRYAFILWSGVDHVVMRDQLPPLVSLCEKQIRLPASHLQSRPSVDRPVCESCQRHLAALRRSA